jgi:hypothetical protein
MRAKKITQIYAVAHMQADWGYGPARTNHWAIYLATSKDHSVPVDCTPSQTAVANGTVLYGGFKAIIIVASLSYARSHNATQITKITPFKGLTVAHVIDLIIASGRDRYEFTAEGVGCRRWCTDTLFLLEQNGYARTGQIQSALHNIKRLWPESTYLPLDRGEYY